MSKLWSAKELAEYKFKEIYLVDPIVPQGGLIFMHGKRNLGKSQLVLTLVTCVSEGGVLFGRYPVRGSGNVVYVQADMPETLQQMRVVAARRFYSLNNLYFFFPDFVEITHIVKDSELVQRIRALKPVLIVWDTLAKIYHGDTNVDYSSSIVYAKVKELFPAPCSHMFVHHDKKTQIEQDKLDDEELFRGSGAWLDNADTGMHLSGMGGGRLSLRFTKVRSAAKQPPVALNFSLDNLLLYANGDRLADLVSWFHKHRPNSNKEELKRFLMSSFVANAQIVDHFLDTGAI